MNGSKQAGMGKKTIVVLRPPAGQEQHNTEVIMNPYNYEGYGQCEIGAPDFFSVAKVGTEAPAFTMTDLDGKKVSLTDFRTKKHVLLEFGSIT